MPFVCRQRRRLVAGVLGAVAFPTALAAAPSGPRRLALYHTHTGERLRIEYHDGRGYSADALAEIDTLLRDFRTGEQHRMDPALLDLLHAAQRRIDRPGTFEIISGYRSPATNEMLRQRSDGVAKRSLHMQGRALDVRLAGTDTGRLHKAALALAAGGVGYYPGSDFVHLDTGRVRSW